jgi:hypothetical protein
MDMRNTISKNTSYTLLGVLTTAMITYVIFDYMFTLKEQKKLFEQAEIPYFL